MDKSILYKLSYGLYAIGAQDGACIANTVFQITSTPAVIALSMNKNNATHDLIQKSGRFSVSILNEDVPSEIISTLGFASSRDTDKFTGLPWKKINGLPVLEKGSSGYLLCRIRSVDPDHNHISHPCNTDYTRRNLSLSEYCLWFESDPHTLK